jgi:tetratricopeptide (TPR) repeat protein
VPRIPSSFTRWATIQVGLLIGLTLAIPAASDTGELTAAYTRYKEALDEKDYATALVYARKSDQLAAEQLAENDPRKATLAYNLGTLYYRLDRHQDAVEPLARATEAYRTLHGQGSMKTLPSLQRLALNYQALQNWREAEKSYLAAVRVIEASEGRKSETLAPILIQLSSVAEAQAAFKRQQNYGRRALYLYDQAGKSRGLASARIHVDLVGAEMQLGDAARVNQHMEWAIEIYDEKLSPDDPLLLEIYTLASQVYEKTGRETEARKYRRRARELTP